MITCEHCGSPLLDGAIFCGECGRAVSASANRRPAAPAVAQQDAPPPLQTPDPHGRPRQDPASEAWLPEATLDPATRAWLTGRDRSTPPVAPIPVTTPGERTDDLAPRTAPTHVHGAGSGVDEWARRDGAERPRRVPAAAPEPVREPSLDPDDHPSEPTPAAVPEEDARPGGPVLPSDGRRQQAPPPAAPAAPSWWVGRSAAAAETVGTAADDRDAAHAGPVVPGRSAAPDVADGAADRTGEDPAPRAGAGPSIDAQAAPAAAAADVAAQAPDAGSSQRADPVAAHANDTAVVPPIPDRPVHVRPAPLVQPGSQPSTCHMCGHRLEPDDIFCEECGAVRPAVTAAFTGPVVPLPVERPDWAADDAPIARDDAADDLDAAGPARRTDPAHRADPPRRGDPSSASDSDRPSAPDPAVHAPSSDDPSAADAARRVPTSEPDEPAGGAGDGGAPRVVLPPMPGSATVPSSAPRAEPLSPGPFTAPLPPVPRSRDDAALPAPSDPVPTSADADESASLDEDVEATRIVGKEPHLAPFLLHCSTGERLAAHGSGLLGRLPRPEAGERFDDLLTVRDPGKSVSKTHLELGRDGDDLWVSDRFSGNGTVIRHIDGSIRRCEPGRRYRVERGARVDIGEQFFLVQ